MLSDRKSPEYRAQGKCCTVSPGSETMAFWKRGISGSLGDPAGCRKDLSAWNELLFKPLPFFLVRYFFLHQSSLDLFYLKDPLFSFCQENNLFFLH